MASVKNKRKAAGTGGGKRSAPGATYSKNKTVGKDTTPQVERAYNDLSVQQKEAASKLELTKEQAIQLDERQATLINANVGSYDEAKKQQLKDMYSNVTTDKSIRSGSSGMSKIEVQQYKQDMQQKSFGTNVAVGPAQHIITRNNPESRASQLKTFDAETKKWEVPATVLKNLESNVRTRGDWKVVTNMANRSVIAANNAERERIQLARNYVIKHSDNSERTRAVLAENDRILTAKTPITGAMSWERTLAIKDAREKLVASYPEAKRDSVNAYFNWIDSVSLSTAHKANLNSFMKQQGKVQQFKTVNQAKNEKLDNDLKQFAGDSKLKAVVADIYRVTSSVENLKSLETPFTDKAYGGKLPNLKTIEIKRDKALDKVGLLEAQRKGQAKIYGNSVGKAVFDFTAEEIEKANKNPLKYGAETAALLALGGVYAKGAKGLTVLSKGASKKVLGKKLAETAVFGAKTPVLKKIAVQNLPMVAVDAYFASEIGKAYALGAKVGNKQFIELSPGQKISKTEIAKRVLAAKKSGKDIDWITQGNLKLTKDLALMGIGAKAAGAVTKTQKPHGKTISTKHIKTKETVLKKSNHAALGKKSVTQMSAAEARAHGRANRTKLNARRAEKRKMVPNEQVSGTKKKSVVKMSATEARELGRSRRKALVEKRASTAEKSKLKENIVGKKSVTQMSAAEAREYGRALRAKAKAKKANVAKTSDVKEITLELTKDGELIAKEYAPKSQLEETIRHSKAIRTKMARNRARKTLQRKTVTELHADGEYKKAFATDSQVAAAKQAGNRRRTKVKIKKATKQTVSSMERFLKDESGELLQLSKPRSSSGKLIYKPKSKVRKHVDTRPVVDLRKDLVIRGKSKQRRKLKVREKAKSREIKTSKVRVLPINGGNTQTKQKVLQAKKQGVGTKTIMKAKATSAVKQRAEQTAKQVARQTDAQTQRQEQGQEQIQKQTQTQKQKQKVLQKSKGAGKLRLGTQTTMLIPQFKRKAKKLVSAPNGKKYKRAHRTIRNKMGNLESMFGGSEPTTKRKTTARKVTAKKSKSVTSRKTTTKRSTKQRVRK